MRKRGMAFTLIELLVVVAIIAVLVAILLPALTAARAQAHQAVCGSNLKQIALGYCFYTDAYSVYPPNVVRHPVNPAWWKDGRTWDSYVFEYTKATAVFRCPADKTTFTDGRETRSYSQNASFQSNWNAAGQYTRAIWLGPDTLGRNDAVHFYPSWTYGHLVEPAKHLLTTEKAGGWMHGNWNAAETGGHEYYGTYGQTHAYRGTNVLFCDLHVEWLGQPRVVPMPSHPTTRETIAWVHSWISTEQ